MGKSKHTFEQAKLREQIINRSYGSLRATIRSIALEVESYLTNCPDRYKPLFLFYHSSLSDAFSAMDREKPTVIDKYESSTDRQLRTLNQELELEK